MKKQMLNLGKALSKTEQKEIFGGERSPKGLEGWCSGDANNYGLPSGCACVSSTNCIMGVCNKGGWSPYGTCA